MEKKKEEKGTVRRITAEDQLKYEIAEELGLIDKVIEHGWKSLSSKESGKIGGLMASRKKELAKESKESLEKNFSDNP